MPIANSLGFFETVLVLLLVVYLLKHVLVVKITFDKDRQLNMGDSRLIQRMYEWMQAEQLTRLPGDVREGCFKKTIFKNSRVTIVYVKVISRYAEPVDEMRFVAWDHNELVIGFHDNEITKWIENNEPFDPWRKRHEILCARTLMNNLRRELNRSSA